MSTIKKVSIKVPPVIVVALTTAILYSLLDQVQVPYVSGLSEEEHPTTCLNPSYILLSSVNEAVLFMLKCTIDRMH